MSTRIEGSKLPDRDVERILGNIEVKSFDTRDEQEVAGYASVMETSFASWSVMPLTEDHLNRLIKDGYLVQHGKGKGTWYSLP